MATPTTFREQLQQVILPKLQMDLGIKNPMAAPQFKKVIVNVGIGSRYAQSKDFSDVLENISAITGQKPIVVSSRKAISNFKLREGMPNGVKVTLRGKRMYDFLSRLIHVALPRTRDFQGMSAKAFDKRGSYSLGMKDISVFPEVNQDDLSHIHGLQITIVTTSDSDEHARALLAACHFPFKKEVAVEQKISVESGDDSSENADDSGEEQKMEEASNGSTDS
jgi:large subunit ribosomal protein L5